LIQTRSSLDLISIFISVKRHRPAATVSPLAAAAVIEVNAL
jgi:hypothetical protein